MARYKASAGQKAYEDNRKNSCRHYDFLSRSAFLEYVFKHFTEDGWSLDVCAGRAVLDGEFTREQIACTKTLYRYVDLGLFGIRNHNLPEKIKRKSRKHRSWIKQLQEAYSKHFGEVFKTITTDNGSEFADLSELEKMADTHVYYAHPCTSLHILR